jgi:alkylation response protein AidB-like acyl-CoA dehydrogenase
MQVRLRELVDDLISNDRSAVDDPSTLRRLGELDTRIKNLEILCQRSISAGMHGGDAFATAGLAKSVWGQIGKDLAALAFDSLRPGTADGRWDEYRLTSHALTIAGGTTQISKNITAQRVLGLPRS